MNLLEYAIVMQPGDPPPSALLVEDDEQYRHLLETAFSHGKFAVRAAATAAEALRCAAAEQPDVVVTDYSLGESTAGTVIAGIRRRARPPGPVMVVLTGHASERLHEKTLDKGADAYFVKSQKSVTVIVADVRAMLNLTRRAADPSLRAGPVRLDPLRRALIYPGRPPLELPLHEAELVAAMMRRYPDPAGLRNLEPRREFPIQKAPGNLRVHMSNLRTKFREHHVPLGIETCSDCGYALVLTEGPPAAPRSRTRPGVDGRPRPPLPGHRL